jgi:hypothetical protein
MIHLRPDCLVFKTNAGENIPCSAEEVIIELVGEASAVLDEELVKNAAQAVLHFFKTEMGRSSVSISEFSLALEQALRGFGFEVKSAPAGLEKVRIVDTDLRLLAGESTEGFELLFFARLRQELRLKLEQSPQVVRFSGLRGCVKQLVGAKRWGLRCQSLNDQIVEFLRTCLSAESGRASCALVVQ